MTQTIHLIEVGSVSAKPVRDFAPGESMAWNYGSTSEIASLTPSASGKTIIVTFADGSSRRMKATRLAAIGHRACVECGGLRPEGEQACNGCNVEAISEDLAQMYRDGAPAADIDTVERALARYEHTAFASEEELAKILAETRKIAPTVKIYESAE